MKKIRQFDMWQFLTTLAQILKDVKWKKAINQISMIPKSLRVLLIFAVAAGTVYFGYTKFFHEKALYSLQQDVTILHERVQGLITEADYNVDIAYLITTIYLLEELDDYSYHTAVLNNKILIDYIKEKYPDDPALDMLKRNTDNMERVRSGLKNDLYNILHKIDPNADEILKKPEK